MRDGNGDPPTLLICAGVPKAGTTWLYEYLRSHSDCHIREIKELNYYNCRNPEDWARRLKLRRGQRAEAAQSLEQCSWRDRARRRWLKDRIRALEDWQKIDPNAPDHAGYREYLCTGRKGQRLVADITPEYMMLDAETLRDMRRTVPDVRFLLLLRDPVDRAWSHLRMRAHRRRDEGSGFEALLQDFLDKFVKGRIGGLTARSDYVKALRNLDEAAAPGKLHVTFFEQLFDPATGEASLRALTDFLGISFHPGDRDRIEHKSPEQPLEPEVRRQLFSVFEPQYAFCNEWFKGDLPQRWRETMAMEAA